MIETVSKTHVFRARLTAMLVIALLVVGVAWYGVSSEELQRIWQNILARPGGPMTFRFILQPSMAILAALRDGIKDARGRRSPYLWSLVTKEARGDEHLWEALISTAQIILLGLLMDTIYQFIELQTFYPVEAVIVALALAFLPYVILRGPIARIARWWGSAGTADKVR